MAAGTNAPTQRDPSDIVADIEATRERLAGTIDAIVDRTNPKNVATRALGRVKAHFVDQSGSVRPEKVAPVVGAVVGVVVLVVALRRFVGD